jgi:diadenosine tetraphosphate (Ap4A) HIT family hydrolase
MLMLEKTFPLSSKMRISVDHKKIGNFSQSHVKFYLKYSSFVFKALKKPSFQKFLHWMLKKEKIEEKTVRAVHVKVLPFRRKNGKGVAGKCNTARGRIRIYPKTVKFCQIFKQKFGRNTLLAYAGNRARAALIHELLHLKYAEDEKTVRELAKDYFCIFTQKQPAQSGHSLFIYSMIFDAKISGKLLQAAQTIQV